MSDKPNQEKPIAKIMPADEVRRRIGNYKATCDPATLLQEAGKLWGQLDITDGKEKEKIREKLGDKLEEVAAITSPDNHYLITETIRSPKLRTLMLEITNRLIAEFQCNTSSEKMLAETAAWAYTRMIEYSLQAGASLEIEFLSSQKNGYYTLLAKEVDRANRQYITALNTLKRFKQPPVTVSFKADTAFVAQNQQINANKPEGSNNAKQ
ncbi:MAG TPA: hypothetical protein PJ993_02525 [Candidatus Saccharibacteria bacterium]|nr:hypothetical protein [Candidatus Saccharibacteria bacterium]HMT39780.1 hypothetical protein [Candidatus Saccharibacteria bacterium]